MGESAGDPFRTIIKTEENNNSSDDHHSDNNDNKNDAAAAIIVLDDDFIQTTFGFLNTASLSSSSSIKESSNTNILIDLTNCDDDFDMNELLMLNSSSSSSSSLSSSDSSSSSSSSSSQKIFIHDDADADADDDYAKEEEKPTTSKLANVASFIDYRAQQNSSINNPNQSIKCDYCSKTFSKNYNYKRHLHNLHADRQIQSNFSSVVTKKQKHCSNAAQKHSMLIIFQCELCNRQFNKKFNYHRHLRMHYLNEVMNHQHDNNNNSNIKNKHSNRRTPSIISSFLNLPKLNYLTTSLDNHALMIEQQIHECEKCARKFNESKQLTDHKQKWHQLALVCPQCSNDGDADSKKKIFTEKFDYIRHLNEKHSIRYRFECKICRKSFQHLSQYLLHKRIHLIGTSNLSFQQQKAEDGDEEERDDNRMQTEEEDCLISESDFKCENCGKKFSKLYNLKRHLLLKHRHHANNKSNNNNRRVVSDTTSSLSPANEQQEQQPHLISNNEALRIRFECNNSQRSCYERNKLNFHLNKVHLRE